MTRNPTTTTNSANEILPADAVRHAECGEGVVVDVRQDGAGNYTRAIVDFGGWTREYHVRTLTRVE